MLDQLTPEQWSGIDVETRKVLTNNQSKLFQYIFQLETTISEYERWRTARD